MLECKKSKHALKCLFAVLLFSIFLACFGVPAIEKFGRDENVVVVTTETAPDGLASAPAITVCRLAGKGNHGWKKGIKSSRIFGSSYVKTACNGTSGETLHECILNSTFSKEETATRFPLKEDKDHFKFYICQP